MGKLIDVIREQYPALSTPLMEMRAQARAAGPLSERERELCIIASLVSLQGRDALEAHFERALRVGADRDEVRHAILATIGVSAVISHVATALLWADEWFDSEAFEEDAR